MERHVDPRRRRSGEAEIRLAHPERGKQEFARRVGRLRLQVRFVGEGLFDPELGGADRGRNGDRLEVSDLRHHRAEHRPVEELAGRAAAFDISNPAQPRRLWEIDMNPPHRGPHTVSPIVYNTVPNFGKAALPRTYAFIVDEAGGAADMAPCPGGVRSGSYMLDITNESKPFPVSVWQVPVGNFCEKGGRFGPHQSAETVNGKINRFEDKLAWLAYFNAGIRIVDLSNPYRIEEVGYYIPKINKNSHPISKDQKTAIQINDVDIDHRGLVYASDRVGTGLFILEYTGRKPRQATSQ